MGAAAATLLPCRAEEPASKSEWARAPGLPLVFCVLYTPCGRAVRGRVVQPRGGAGGSQRRPRATLSGPWCVCVVGGWLEEWPVPSPASAMSRLNPLCPHLIHCRPGGQGSPSGSFLHRPGVWAGPAMSSGSQRSRWGMGKCARPICIPSPTRLCA